MFSCTDRNMGQRNGMDTSNAEDADAMDAGDGAVVVVAVTEEEEEEEGGGEDDDDTADATC